MTDNPILNLLYDDSGNLKEEIADIDLEKFEVVHVVPLWKIISQINEYQTQNPDPSRADSRNNLVHLWDAHNKGYTPFGDLAFISDQECDYLHAPIIHQIFKYLKGYGENIQNDTNNRTDVWSCTEDGHFLKMALLYEVLPDVGQRLKSAITSEELSIRVHKIFEKFQMEVVRFNQVGKKYDTGLFALGKMNLAVFGGSLGIKLDGSLTYPTYQFGPKNDGDDLKAIQLLEGTFRALINKFPFEKDTLRTTEDGDVNYLEYGSGYVSSAETKIDLFVSGVEATRLVRQIIAEQHKALYADDRFSQDIARYSNDFYSYEAFLKFADANAR
jgi:hypothetical protein